MIEIRQEHLPDNYRLLSVLYINISEAQRQLRDYFNALSTHQRTLTMKKQIHPDVATTHHSMATVYIKIDDFKSALEHEERSANLQLFRNYLDRIRSIMQTT